MNMEDTQNDKRIIQVTLWLNKKEYIHLKKKSAELDLSYSAYLRKCINEEIAFLDSNLKKVVGLFAISENKKR